MRAVVLAVAAALTTTGITSPSELLTGVDPSGFELADAADADLTFDEYAPLSPEAVAHVDPSSAEADVMRAATDVWTAGDDDILLREVTLWSDPEEARRFVEQAVVVGVEDGLRQIDAPFDGAVAFLGDDTGLRTRRVTWRQGPYAVTVSHYAANPSRDRVINANAEALAERIAADTAHEVDASGILPEGSTTADRTATSADRRNVIASLLLWLVIIALGVWSYLAMRRRRARNRALLPGPGGRPGRVDRHADGAEPNSGSGEEPARPGPDHSDRDPESP